MPKYISKSSVSSFRKGNESQKRLDTKVEKEVILFQKGKPFERQWTLNPEYDNWLEPRDEPLFYKGGKEVAEDDIQMIKEQGLEYDIVGEEVKPAKGLRLEYIVEYVGHVLRRHSEDFFPTFADFMKAVKKAKVVSIPSDSEMHNRGWINSPEDLISAISWQRSYPKFKNEQHLNKMQKQIEQNQPIDMPIVLELPDGEWELMSGNTRLGFALINKMPNVKVLLVPVEEENP